MNLLKNSLERKEKIINNRNKNNLKRYKINYTYGGSNSNNNINLTDYTKDSTFIKNFSKLWGNEINKNYIKLKTENLNYILPPKIEYKTKYVDNNNIIEYNTTIEYNRNSTLPIIFKYLSYDTDSDGNYIFEEKYRENGFEKKLETLNRNIFLKKENMRIVKEKQKEKQKKKKRFEKLKSYAKKKINSAIEGWFSYKKKDIFNIQKSIIELIDFIILWIFYFKINKIDGIDEKKKLLLIKFNQNLISELDIFIEFNRLEIEMLVGENKVNTYDYIMKQLEETDKKRKNKKIKKDVYNTKLKFLKKNYYITVGKYLNKYKKEIYNFLSIKKVRDVNGKRKLEIFDFGGASPLNGPIVIYIKFIKNLLKNDNYLLEAFKFYKTELEKINKILNGES